MTAYVYIKSERAEFFTVGFSRPDGEWIPESDHKDRETAARRVNYLNGGVGRVVAHRPPELSAR